VKKSKKLKEKVKEYQKNNDNTKKEKKEGQKWNNILRST
jgi:hypothetical protein